ncbi:MAG TPA: hypothetical protein VIM69_00355, partial [Opitutaceae bacterium]
DKHVRAPGMAPWTTRDGVSTFRVKFLILAQLLFKLLEVYDSSASVRRLQTRSDGNLQSVQLFLP